jgi:ferredoxin-NADP reductase
LPEILIKRQPDWQIATVLKTQQETSWVRTITLALQQWTPHNPGQHYDIRLTIPEGYGVQRSYSVASSPDLRGEIELTVGRLESGGMSTYLHDVLQVGDTLELRGPLGGRFIWETSQPGPLLLVAGGSGIVPLMSMLRHRCTTGSIVQTRLLYSSRTYEDIIYREELEYLNKSQAGLEIIHTLTRRQPAGWNGLSRRIDLSMLKEITASLDEVPNTFICGPTELVEMVSSDLKILGIPAERIRTEKFGSPIKTLEK